MKQSRAGTEIEVFDERPITLPGWKFSHCRAEPVGEPTIDETQNALTFASATESSSPWWVCDVVSYINEHTKWGEKASQITAATGFSTDKAYRLSALVKHVAQPERELAPSFEHARVVAKLPAPEQRKWLKKATVEGWGKRELDQELKASQKRGVIKGTAALEGMFRVWLIDFPWRYAQAQPSKTSASTRYPTMGVKEGIAMGNMVRAHTTRHAVAFWWVTAPMLYYATDPDKGPDPFRIMRAWGFEPKTGGVWDKVLHNFGHYLSIRHEHLLIATRGSCTPDRPTPMLDSVFTERKSDVHSEKPKLVYKMIERLYDGQRCEMFAREPRKGWVSYGNQIGVELTTERRRA